MQLQAEGREARAYVRGGAMPMDMYKRMARLCALPGYEPIKQDAHVEAWSAYTAAQTRMQRVACAKHDSHVRQWKKERPAEWSRHRYRTDEARNAYQKTKAHLRRKVSLDGAIASNMAGYLRRGKFGNGWQELLGYTPAQLVAHLRRTVPKGRTWDEFISGALHIDHITPCADFDLTRKDEVRACWSLGNLRLLDAEANRKKRAKKELLL